MSELAYEQVDADPEPEPAGLKRYLHRALDMSHGLEDRLSYGEWITDTDSRLSMQAYEVRARLSRQAFLNYTQLSVDERFQLEAVASIAMAEIGQVESPGEVTSMMNHVPLLFEPRGGAMIGRRNDDEGVIVIESEGIATPHQRDVLAGGLATILFFTDYPRML